MASRSVGSVSRTRVSSLTTPSLSGTLKSTRMNTRLPRKSTSLIVSLFTETAGLDAALTITMRDEWRDDYRSQKAQPSMASFRKPVQAMRKTDWDAMYREIYKERTK